MTSFSALPNTASAAEDFDRLRDEIKASLDMPPSPSKVAASTIVDKHAAELDRFLETGERLLTVQRKKIVAMQSAYEIERTKLLDGFRVRMVELEQEAAETMRTFDANHETALRSARRMEDALTAMRG